MWYAKSMNILLYPAFSFFLSDTVSNRREGAPMVGEPFWGEKVMCGKTEWEKRDQKDQSVRGPLRIRCVRGGGHLSKSQRFKQIDDQIASFLTVLHLARGRCFRSLVPLSFSHPCRVCHLFSKVLSNPDKFKAKTRVRACRKLARMTQAFSSLFSGR